MNPSENPHQWLARIPHLGYDPIFWQNDEHHPATHHWQTYDLGTIDQFDLLTGLQLRITKVSLQNI
jgi:hypothetical protein